MKRLVFILLFLVFFFVPTIAHADDSWVIENFNSNIAIQQSGVVKVIETISVDFRDNPKHGIYRDIPYLYQENGKQTYTKVDIIQVLQNNQPAQYTVSQTSGNEEIQIGNPNQTITGRNVYTIAYNITGVLRDFTDHDELYWNVTGNDWQVEIQRAEAAVSLPAAGITQITCYQGVAGSETPCQSTIESSKIATFVVNAPLAETEGLTSVVGFRNGCGLVPILIATPPKSYWEKIICMAIVVWNFYCNTYRGCFYRISMVSIWAGLLVCRQSVWHKRSARESKANWRKRNDFRGIYSA